MRHEVLFGKERIGKLIAKTCAPAMFTILVMMLYNMADIFFIGRTGDAKQVASIALVAPVMSILSGLGTLVGSGGCAAIAVELEKGNAHKARQMSSFSAWFSVVLGIVFAVGVTIFMQPLLFLLGTSTSPSQNHEVTG